MPWAFVLALSLLSPLFYLSLFFSILAPLPLLYLHQGTGNIQAGRRYALLAIPAGTIIIFVIRGLLPALGFLLFAAAPALVLGEAFYRKVRLEVATLLATGGLLLGLFTFGLILLGVMTPDEFTQLTQTLKDQATQFATTLLKSQNNLSEESRAELHRIIENPKVLLLDLPGLLLGGMLLLSVIPSIAMIRWNPKGFLARSGLSRDALRRFRTPDWLVWPTLISFALIIFTVPHLTPIAQNLLKPLILIYFFQGMSMLAFFLDSIRLRGTFRILIYLIAVVFLTPMVVSFGFFDLWFNFRERAKNRNKGNTP